jgi:hypothetical protein
MDNYWENPMKKLVATLLVVFGLALVANVYAAETTTKPTTTTTSAPAK